MGAVSASLSEATPRLRRLLDLCGVEVFRFLMQRLRASLVSLLVLLGALTLGCERTPPAAPEQPCACEAAQGSTPHRASGRTEIIR
jgi:hypothetical protein